MRLHVPCLTIHEVLLNIHLSILHAHARYAFILLSTATTAACKKKHIDQIHSHSAVQFSVYVWKRSCCQRSDATLF